jgi:hypothetical protein
MRKLTICAVALAAMLAVPAQGKPAKPDPSKPTKPHPAKSHKCIPHKVAYRASGTLVSESLFQTAGADTPKRGDDRYSGPLKVAVTKANHHAAKGEQTYTLDNARVRFYDADHNGTTDPAKAGDRVKLIGKITTLPKKCDATGFTAATTIRKVDFKPAKTPKP